MKKLLRKSNVLILIAAVLLAGLIMVFSVGQSIWFDEGYSILLAQKSWPELFALTAVDAHPPFYYALLKVWGSVFGFGDTALRLLSAVMVSGALVTAFVLLRKVFSTKVALLTLPFLVLAPFMIRYGYEVRMYALAMLIGVVATYVLIVAQKSKQWWSWAVYAVLVALGMYTLYMTVVVWLAHLVWLIVVTIKSKEGSLWKSRWFYAYVGSVVLFLPYIAVFIQQMLHSALPGIGNEITLTRLVDIVTTLFVFTPEWQVGGWLSLLIITGVILTGVVIARTYPQFSKNEKKYYWLIASIVLVSLAFYALTSLPPRTPIFVNRYLAHISLFIYMLLGVTLAFGVVYKERFKKAHRALPFIAYGVAVIILSIGMVRLYGTGNFVFERMQYPQTQQIRQSIECSDETTIVADDPYTYIDSVFYLDGCDVRFYAPEEVAFKGGYAPLHGSDRRIESTTELESDKLIHLHWDGKDSSLIIDKRYRLDASNAYDKQRVDVYTLIAE